MLGFSIRSTLDSCSLSGESFFLYSLKEFLHNWYYFKWMLKALIQSVKVRHFFSVGSVFYSHFLSFVSFDKLAFHVFFPP